MVRDVVNAAHSPALGLERSVCLRQVTAFLRLRDPSAGGWGRTMAEAVEEEFGTDSDVHEATE